jgi:hypothetical protein
MERRSPTRRVWIRRLVEPLLSELAFRVAKALRHCKLQVKRESPARSIGFLQHGTRSGAATIEVDKPGTR